VDPQDGPISNPAQLYWNDAWQNLGSGANLALTDLPVGVHVIAFNAINSLGVSNSSYVTVTVGDDLQDPPPDPSVGPSFVNWQVAAGETVLQSAALTLTNTGGDAAIDWTAVSDAPWLALDQSAGTVPATLTLSGDPSGLVANSSNTANVTITFSSAALPAPVVVVVPVSLQVGAGETWQAVLDLIKLLYLPLMSK
jgi:hypothetical protein